MAVRHQLPFYSIDPPFNVSGVVQTQQTGDEYNGESNLDLQYGMTLVTGKQPVQLYQVGDIDQGETPPFRSSVANSIGIRQYLRQALRLTTSLMPSTGCIVISRVVMIPNMITPTQTLRPMATKVYPPIQCIRPYPSANHLTRPIPGKDCGTVKPALVISTSYTYNEADFSVAYTARQCAEYAKLGLQGVTVLYVSGDDGVGGGGYLCLNDDGKPHSSNNAHSSL